MSLLLDGYTSTTLVRASRLTRIYEATRADGLPVVAKVIELSSVDHGQWLELERACALTVDGMAATLAVERMDDRLVILSERLRGVDLRELGDGAPLALETFLPVARRMTEILAALHEHDFVHGGLWPGSVILSHDAGQVLLEPPMVSALLELDLDDVERLPYISPEHTGRTHAGLDRRSDLYSLGAVFYRMLTSLPPFVRADAQSMVHAHLAETPERPTARRPRLPVALSRLVMKLLAKLPAQRYQSAGAVLDDLDRVKRSLDSSDTHVTLAGDESSVRVADAAPELSVVRDELELMLAEGQPRLLLSDGAPGSGHTALIDVLEREILSRRGQVGRGRFEAARSRVPYVAWVQAIDDVLAQLLLGPRSELEAKRAHIEQRLGRLAALLTSLLPALECVLGEVPAPPPRVGLAATRNRMQLAFARLLAALSETAPLALVFDDLHAADDDSLALLDALLDGSNCGPVVLVGCMRSGATRPRILTALVERLGTGTAAPLRGLLLELPGSEPACSPDATLAELEPFDAELLGRAACVGAAFDLPTLALALDQSGAELIGGLSRCCSAGLLQRRRSVYVFTSSRVHAATLATVLPAFRRMLDERLGAALLARAGGDAPAAWMGVACLDASLDDGVPITRARALELARANFDAARRAFEFSAHAAALSFLDVAGELLGGLDDVDPQLSFELQFARMQALELLGDSLAGEASFDALLEQCTSDAAYARVLTVRLELLRVHERNAEAVSLGLAALRRCGCEVDANPGTAGLVLVLTRAWLGFRRWTSELARAQPPASDPCVCAALDIAAALGPAAYAHDPRLFLTLSAAHAMLILRHGTHSSAALAIAQLAVSIATVLRRTEDATRLADCAMALADDLEQPEYTRTQVVACLVYSLTRPLSETAETLDLAYRRSLQLGEFDFVSYLAALRSSANFELGTHLRSMVQDCHRLDRDLGNWGSSAMRTLVRLNGALAAALLGDIDGGLGELVTDERGTRLLPIDPASLVAPTQMELYTTKMVRGVYFVLMGEFVDGLRTFDEIDDYERVMMGSWSVPRAALTHAVAAAACHADASLGEQRRLRRLVEGKLTVIQRWSEASVENYGAHHDIVLAEHSMLLGNSSRAMRLLERARERAMARGNAYVAALACERMAAHTRARGLPTLANGALREAWQIHRHWGARAKLRVLEREQLERDAERSTVGELEHGSSLGLGKSSIDLETVTSALTAIAEELDPERLASKILQAALTHTGADHGALLIAVEHTLCVAALARADQPVRALWPPEDFTEHVGILPMALLEQLISTHKPIVVDDVRLDPFFASDYYVERAGVRSLAGIQLRKRNEALGVILLENHARVACFDEERMSILGFLATSAGAALDNAGLYRALRRSESRWRSLVDGAPDLIALLDTSGRLTFVNHALPGWELGRQPALASESVEGWMQTLSSVLESGRRAAVEIRVDHDSGTPRWYDAHLAPIEFEGDTRQVVVIATEITERRAAEAMRSALEGQLRQQQRLESVGTLASGVAHEINNPVQAILNYAELAIKARNDPELVEEFAAEIMTESERVATIVRNLLAFSRREATPERELVAVSSIVRGTLSLVHSSLRSSQIELVVDVPEQLPLVCCHAQQIQQIIMNLVTNARDALDERWPEHHANKRIELRAQLSERHDREHVRLTVADRGPGIPESVRAHIFDPFFTTKGRDRGTGLGLSVSHGIAQDHGGELWVESEVGVGTQFHLDLPIGRDELSE